MEEQREYYLGWKEEGGEGCDKRWARLNIYLNGRRASRLARIPSSTYTHLIYVLFSAVFRARMRAPCIHRHVADTQIRSFTCGKIGVRGEGTIVQVDVRGSRA